MVGVVEKLCVVGFSCFVYVQGAPSQLVVMFLAPSEVQASLIFKKAVVLTAVAVVVV